jgi:hypothetical protein
MWRFLACSEIRAQLILECVVVFSRRTLLAAARASLAGLVWLA